MRARNPQRQWVLDADLTAAFDRINHQRLLDQLGTFPARVAVAGWLAAGVVERGRLSPTVEGTPQGGVISPLLLNGALHGMEEAAGVRYLRCGPQGAVVAGTSPALARYADDLVVICHGKDQAEQARQRLAEPRSADAHPSNGVEQGEDWAEVVSTRVAELLGVPCAQTRLCSRHGRRGSLSLDVTRLGFDLNEGSAVLEAAQVPGYFPHREGHPGVDPARPGMVRPGHSLANIKGVLIDKLPPDDFAGPSPNGFDVFVGYVILDALIANRDRHEQNWAVLTSRLLNQVDRLAPSYDHGGSLGYNLPDGERRRRVDDPAALLRWAEGGTAWRFEHQRRRPLSLVELAQDGITLCTPEAAEWWVRRISRLDLGPVVSALEHGVPGMSDAAATFVIKLLDLNRRRLLHAICPA